MYKKITALLLLLVCLLTLFTACGNKTEQPTAQDTNTEQPSEAESTTQPIDRSTLRIAMIGDSLVAGLQGYEVTERIDFFGSVNLTTQGIFTKSSSDSEVAIIDRIAGDSYDVIIVLLGINEIAYDTATWISQYKDVIEGIKLRAPNAEVWIHAILPVSQSAEDSSQFGVTNAGINEKNTALQGLCAETGCTYLDAGEIFKNEAGILSDGVASDGIHPTKPYCETWANFIITKVTN